MACKVCI